MIIRYCKSGITSIIFVLSLFINGIAYAATACEYSFPGEKTGTCATEHQGCASTYPKAPNGASLMRVCQSCVLVPASYGIERNSDNTAVASVSCGIQVGLSFAQDYIDDFNTLCITRGGITSVSANILKCSFIAP